MLPAHQVGHVSSLLSETQTKISSFRLIILVSYCLCWRPTKNGSKMLIILLHTHYNSNLIWRMVSHRADGVIPSDHPRREASRVIQWYGLIHETWYCTPDQVTFIIISLLYTFFWHYCDFINCFGLQSDKLLERLALRFVTSYLRHKIWSYVIMFSVSGSMLENYFM